MVSEPLVYKTFLNLFSKLKEHSKVFKIKIPSWLTQMFPNLPTKRVEVIQQLPRRAEQNPNDTRKQSRRPESYRIPNRPYSGRDSVWVFQLVGIQVGSGVGTKSGLQRKTIQIDFVSGLETGFGTIRARLGSGFS